MNDEDEITPQRNDSLINLYELLSSLITSLTPSITTNILRDGSGEKLNRYIDELKSLTTDKKLEDFKIPILHRTLNSKSYDYVRGEAYVRQLTGVVNYLHKVNKVIGYYCLGPPKPQFNKTGSSHTINNNLNAEQQTQQSTNVQIEFTQSIVTLTESLTNLEHEYPDETSKENKFAKALKKSLSTAKDSLGIVALILQVAGAVGLDPHTALKLLKLG